MNEWDLSTSPEGPAGGASAAKQANAQASLAVVGWGMRLPPFLESEEGLWDALAKGKTVSR